MPITTADGKRKPLRAYCKKGRQLKKLGCPPSFGRLPAKRQRLIMVTFRGSIAILLLTFLSEWLENRKSALRPSTYADYEHTMRQYIKPFIGKMKLGDFEERRRCLYAKIGDAGYSQRSAKKAHAVLHTALNHAVQWRQIPRNPLINNIGAPRYKAPRQKVLTNEQSARLLEASKGYLVPGAHCRRARYGKWVKASFGGCVGKTLTLRAKALPRPPQPV